VSSHEIRRTFDESQHRELIAVAARAFWDDPLFDFLNGNDLLDEHRVLPHVFRAAFSDLRSGTAQLYVADMANRPRGFAGWLGPGTFPRSRGEKLVRDIRAVTVLARLRNRRSAAALLREVDRRHPSEDHWYLALLATDPSVRGRGMGTALMQPVLTQCDSSGVPAYTETQKEENVSWYRRVGFDVIDEVRLPDTPPIWRLWRDPVDGV
jgi:GNAT superfamily N-acetyltransferase